MESESINRDTVAASSCVNIAIIDLECTCNSDQNFGPHEIIEIGAVIGTLNQKSFKVISELQIYVRPAINPTLTNFCTELTGITQCTVDAAVTLNDALPVLEDWLQKNNVAAWTSWGKGDATLFTSECALKSLINPMAELQHLNLKQLFARKFGHRVGITRAIMLRGLTFAGQLHSGIDDAKNIGHLLSQEALLREAVLKRISAPLNLNRIQPIDPNLVERVRLLVDGVEIDLNARLSSKDE